MDMDSTLSYKNIRDSRPPKADRQQANRKVTVWQHTFHLRGAFLSYRGKVKLYWWQVYRDTEIQTVVLSEVNDILMNYLQFLIPTQF